MKFGCFFNRFAERAGFIFACGLHRFRHTLSPSGDRFGNCPHRNQMLVAIAVKPGFGDQDFDEIGVARLPFAVDCHNPCLNDVSTRHLRRWLVFRLKIQQVPIPLQLQFTIRDFDW